jgi:GNAT superfamily N-acetyltransferase
MKAAAQQAKRIGCGTMKRWVAKWNDRAIQFYERLGAKIDPDWHEFQMSEEALRKLAVS